MANVFLVQGMTDGGESVIVGVPYWGANYGDDLDLFTVGHGYPADTEFLLQSSYFPEIGSRVTLTNGSYWEFLRWENQGLETERKYIRAVSKSGLTENVFNFGIATNEIAESDKIIFPSSPCGIVVTRTSDTLTGQGLSISNYDEFVEYINRVADGDLYPSFNGRLRKTQGNYPTDSWRFYLNTNSDSPYFNLYYLVNNAVTSSAEARFLVDFWTGENIRPIPQNFEEDIQLPEGNEGGEYIDIEATDEILPEDMTGVLGVGDVGGLHLYSPTFGELSAFRNYLWSDVFAGFWDTVGKLYGSPEECIIALLMIYADIPTNEGSTPIVLGNITSSANASTIKQQYITLNCGSVKIPQIWGNFLDYEPYTTASIYLPYCRTVELPINEIMGGELTIVYNIDVLTGSCLAQLYCKRGNFSGVIATVQGNCGIQIPWSAGNYSQFLSSMIGSLSSATSITSTVGGVADVALSYAPKISRGGDVNTNYGVLFRRKPYILYTRPRQSLPEGYNKYNGFTSNITCKLGDLTGFTQVAKINLSGLPYTSAEIEMLENLLTEGVIF